MKSIIQKRIEEICEECETSPLIIQHFISEEWITPSDQEKMLFDEEDLARIMLILELQEEMGVNDEAVPIILNLIDQLNYIRTTIKKINL